MKLYSYYRSSASYRVRIVMNLKKIAYETEAINLASGEQLQTHFQAINNAKLVPVLELEDGQRITQSTAIIDYLEQHTPSLDLLSQKTSMERTLIQQIVNIIACDIHPLNNLRVLKYLSDTLSVSDEEKNQWYHHWIHKGFSAIEEQLVNSPFATGNNVSMADVYLIPQFYNANRFKLDMSTYPKIVSVCDACEQLEAFIDARPENQHDTK